MKKTILGIFLGTLLAVGLMSALYFSNTMDVNFTLNIKPQTEAQAQKMVVPTPQVPLHYEGNTLPRDLWVRVSRAVNPTVVNIATTQKVQRRQMGPYGGGGGYGRDPLQDFLEQFMGGGMPMQQQPVQSLGSGFIIEPDGLIVTNNHVVAEASEIKVQLSEKSKKLYTAKLIGRDARTDLALIKIQTDSPLAYAVLGDSDKIEEGNFVAAFGNPYGHGHSVTAGIISAREREIPGGEAQYFPFLQTDASINPGNSGGPLVNEYGEVIGVNAAIDARAQGIGFAIPINILKKLLPQLKGGKVTRGFVGVAINDIDERAQKQLRLKTDKGALVLNVTPNSPAAKAGIQNYDVITEVDGKAVTSSRELMTTIAEATPGKTLKLKLLRDGKIVESKVTVTTRPDEQMGGVGPAAPGMKAPYDIGLVFSQLTEDLAQQFEIDQAPAKSVVVTGVTQGSVAEVAGIEVGDIVLDINRSRILKPTDAVKALRRGTNTLRILRGDGTALFYIEAR